MGFEVRGGGVAGLVDQGVPQAEGLWRLSSAAGDHGDDESDEGVGWSAFVLAAINLAFVPAIYFGDDPANFYSVQGWGTTASMGALWSLWTLAVNISVLRSSRRTAVATPARHAPAPVTAA